MLDLSLDEETIERSHSFCSDFPRNAYKGVIIDPSMCWDAAEHKREGRGALQRSHDLEVLQLPEESTVLRPRSKTNSQSTLATIGPICGKPKIQWHILVWVNAYRPEISTVMLGNVHPPHFFQFSLAHPVIRQRDVLLLFADSQPYPATAPEKWTEITQVSELHQGPQRT